MPLGTLDRDPPPFFRQGPSALSKLAVCSALALFLMVADARFKVMQPLRVVLATALYPVQWLALQPVVLVQSAATYFTTVASAESAQEEARRKLSLQSLRANQVEQLELENQRLRKLLDLSPRLSAPAKAAQVLYDAADPFTRKVVINKGLMHQLTLGSPVLDEMGVIGQVTRVYPAMSEVTLITDRDHAIPVLNARTGARGVAFGDTSTHADALELRYMAANADVAVGDLLTTSGVDGVYPPGLPVARVEKVERQVDAVFARIYCVPLALVSGTTHVLVLDPLSDQLPARPVADALAASPKGAGLR
ncbi:MAG: rod shape-determining protein MreC [Curvibacter sp. RIFCSPHIGHO2_12_FULL_63_18]|uniref:rod shape-determining protein MreC n=1 Tax=Rhodoferax sp. TaxID=50421 RepID=UPI0008C2EB40|nr:rod shape-determining protein MreC [Rhodoferax sp.]OGO99097.1 MAG: rod shape-determining protein MreC [Curvibacter sp. RIFCSPHIGHO2_12_FULL_63_18]OGP00336.1 MAG: rod shape-determining protein MreC [Curvibacter sp. GWA2_63_95]HCX82119.1 rod shape-determining protein MreC [Rhodoferax sp.]